MHKKCFTPVLLFVTVLFTASSAFAQKEATTTRPKYVFLFIGDGTSFPQRHAAELYQASLQSRQKADTVKASADQAIQRLRMNTFPIQGLSATHSMSSLITDSSSSATAIATGNKTLNGVIGMDAGGNVPFTSIAKIAKGKGKKVGIITSVSLDHATPAAFYANCPSRSEYYEIAVQAPETGFDYFGGGGFKQVQGKQGNQKNIFDLFREQNYHIVKTRAEFDALTKENDKVLAINSVLDENDALPYAIDRKPDSSDASLADFVHKGIELLDNEDGFFMMVEGGKIDWACHANDALTAILEVIAFDEAVGVAQEFYRQHPDETLIVVTGDHETGGMAIGFTGTGYDAYPHILAGQKGSHGAFDGLVAELRHRYPNPAPNDVLPPVLDFFGLEFHEPDVLERLVIAAAEGDADAGKILETSIQPFEMEQLIQALVMSWKPASEHPRTFSHYITYGGYEPLTVAMTRILNNKAGIAWTTFAHSGLPTPVSAIGVEAERFSGHYDNTDIFRKIVSIAY